MTRAAFCLALLLPVVAQGERAAAAPPRFEAGLQAYRDGDYERAFAVFTALLERGDAAAPVELRLNAALCALRLSRSRDAEELVAPLTSNMGAASRERRAHAAFVLGLAARQHGERAVAAAKLPDAEPMAWVMASRGLQQSELHFRAAVQLRPEWGEAVRNLERTMQRRAVVEAERAAAQPKQSKQEQAPAPEPEVALPEPDPDASPEEVVPEWETAALSADELQQLRQRVHDQQKQKVRGRQVRPDRSRARGERDW